MDNKDNYSENLKPKNSSPDMKGGFSKYRGAIAGFIILAWPPFYGYMFLHGYLSGLGYDNTHVSLDIQEAVWFFSAGMLGLWQNLDGVVSALMYIALALGVIVFMMLLLDLIFVDKIKSKYEDKIKEIKSVNYYAWAKNRIMRSLAISAISGGLIFLISFLVPIFIILAFTISFLFLIVGDTIGLKAAQSDFKNEICIYAKSDSNCAKVSINSVDNSGFIAYSNEKSAFFITSDGRYQLNDRGRVMQYRPFVVDTIKHFGKKSFDSALWASNVNGRSSILNSFISGNKKTLTADHVFKTLGPSDIEFHYPEFPAYKLSEKKDCNVGFPFDWESKRIVNIVLFGDCKGVRN
jgi:hypothetical protein